MEFLRDVDHFDMREVGQLSNHKSVTKYNLCGMIIVQNSTLR